MQIKITVAKWVLLSLGMMGVVTGVSAVAAEVYVIAHPGVTLSASELRDVYLGEKQFSGALKLVPVDNSVAQADFLEKVVNMKPEKYSGLWTKKSFRGDATPPEIKSSDAEVIRFVKSTPGAIGYVSAPIQGVKDIGKF